MSFSKIVAAAASRVVKSVADKFNQVCEVIMKYSSKIARLVLLVSLPVASSSFAMKADIPANQAGQPNIIAMVMNVVNLIKRNPVPSALIGGVAALVAYRLASMKLDKKIGRESGVSKASRSQAGLQEGLAYLAQHAAQAVQLYQAGKLPRAYLHGKYCEVAQPAGIDALPQAERIALLNAVVAFDLAFTGFDYAAKKMVGVQAAYTTAATQLNAVMQQLMAQYGADSRQAKSVSPAGAATSLMQMFMEQFKANPMATVGLILSSGYSLLAQYNGWPPYGPAPTPAPAPAA